MKQLDLIFDSRYMLLEFFHELVASYTFAEAGKHTVVAGYGAEHFVHVQIIDCIADSVCVARKSLNNYNISRKINAYVAAKEVLNVNRLVLAVFIFAWQSILVAVLSVRYLANLQKLKVAAQSCLSNLVALLCEQRKQIILTFDSIIFDKILNSLKARLTFLHNV